MTEIYWFKHLFKLIIINNNDNNNYKLIIINARNIL